MRMLVLLFAICAPAGIAAKAPVTSVQGGYIALSVADLDASAKWYAEIFDLAIVRNHSPSPDQKSAATILSGHGLIVELIQHVDAMPLNRAAPSLSRAFQVHGIFKSGIVVDDLDATFKELNARKVEVAFPIFADAALAIRTFAIRDNSGNLLQFFGK